MNIHHDLSLPATVDAAALDWVPSPTPGVERLMIERQGIEVARATSLVRYAPNSSFPPHTHGGGEEFFVLSGVFSDESGDYPAGSYVRNGVGSHHSPRTAPGCVILVKLWWMHPDETQNVRVMTDTPSAWSPTASGQRCILHHGVHDQTELVRVAAGEHTAVEFTNGLEMFVVSGDITFEDTAAAQWTWLRRPGSGALSVHAPSEATLFIKRGHLQHPPPLPH
ncbi:MAG: cupin domain-containing protein [bacterium]